jgi:hypothetical protein
MMPSVSPAIHPDPTRPWALCNRGHWRPRGRARQAHETCELAHGCTKGDSAAAGRHGRLPKTKAFYLCVRYRTGKGRPQGDFVVRSTRLTMTGFGRFELAYFRHTERWFTVHRRLTAAECFKEIEGNGIFWPVM